MGSEVTRNGREEVLLPGPVQMVNRKRGQDRIGPLQVTLPVGRGEVERLDAESLTKRRQKSLGALTHRRRAVERGEGGLGKRIEKGVRQHPLPRAEARRRERIVLPRRAGA